MSHDIYLLDACVVSYFFQASAENALAKAASHAIHLAIVEEVSDELEKEKTFGAHFRQWLASSGITLEQIFPATPAFEVFAFLHPTNDRLKDKGEHASIAVCAHNRSYVFVTADHGAHWLAANSSFPHDPRVMTLSAFLRFLAKNDLLSRENVAAIVKKSPLQQRLPWWWANWLQSLPSSRVRPRVV